jgi:hypothetical protein
MNTKVCKKCGIERDKDLFNKKGKKNSPESRVSTCRICQSASGIVYSVYNYPTDEMNRIATKNTNSIITNLNVFKNLQILKKKNKNNCENLVHEFFVYKKCIKKILLDKIPNFAYCFDYNQKENFLLLEKVGNISLLDYINSNDFRFSDFLFILIQICLVLQILQNRYGFVHYDTTPWNIMLEYTESRQFVYMLDSENIYTIKTSIIPKLIDFEKSHFIYKNKHYSTTSPFKFSSIQDILILLLNSIHLIINFPLSQNSKIEITKLANFITGNNFRKNPFNSTDKGISELKYFLNKNKKYESIINSNKFELENLKPLDLLNYILSNFNYPFSISKIKNIKYESIINSKHIHNYLLSSSLEEKINSYTNFLNKKCFNLSKNNPYYYYISLINKTIYIILLSLFRKFCRVNKIDEDKKFINPFEEEQILPLFKGNINIKNNKELNVNSKIFEEPNIVLEKLKSIDEKSVLNNIEEKIFLEKMLVNINYDDEKSKQLLLNKLKSYNTKMLVNDSNIFTFIIYSREIFQKNLEYVEKYNCEFSNKMKSIYKDILKF